MKIVISILLLFILVFEVNVVANSKSMPTKIVGFLTNSTGIYQSSESCFEIKNKKEIKLITEYVTRAKLGKAQRALLGNGLLLIFESDKKVKAFYFPSYTAPANAYKKVSIKKQMNGYKWRLSDLEKRQQYMIPNSDSSPNIFKNFWRERGLFQKRK